MKFLAPSILALGLCLAPGLASAESYIIDSTHAHAGFRVSHFGYSTTLGQFRDIAGTLEFDQANPAASTVEVTIKTASVDTANDARDEHLRKADFFNVEQFPTMTFKSTHIEVTGEKTAKITGDLTLLGVTKPVTLDATFNQAAPHPMDNTRYVAGFSATGSLKRTDFGMNYAAPAIGDDIALIIEAEALRQ